MNCIHALLREIVAVAAATGSEELKTAEDLNRLLDHLRPEYNAYLAKRAATLRWHKERSENSVAIRKGVMAWNGEHTRLAAEFKRCGGMNAHPCLEINAGTLKQTAANVHKLGDVPDAINAVKLALDQLKAKTAQACAAG